MLKENEKETLIVKDKKGLGTMLSDIERWGGGSLPVN